MDAPTIGRPMGARCATYTLHRVSAQHLLSHRHPESRVCFPPRAREPFYATFFFVSRCHANGVWVTRAYVCARVGCTCAYAPSFVRSFRSFVSFVRSFVRTLARSLARSLVHPSDGDVRANLDVARRFCFIRESSSSFVRTRASPSSRSCRLSIGILSLSREREKERVREDNSNVPSAAARLIPLSSQPLAHARPRPARAHTRRERTSDVRTPLCAYRAGLQRNAKESLTSTHP